MDLDCIFRVNSRSIWTPYAKILLTGYVAFDASHREYYRRSGPFMPPIAIVPGGNVVVSNEFQIKLQAEWSGTFRFEEITEVKIIPFDWQKWDVDFDDPVELHINGEAEDLLRGEADIAMREAIGPIWWLNPLYEIEIRIDRPGGRREFASKTSYPPTEFFAGRYVGGRKDIFTTENGREFLQRECGKWLEFERVAKGEFSGF